MTDRTSVKVTFEELQEAGTANGVTAEQTERMWNQLSAHAETAPSSGVMVLAYFGSLVTLVALGWFFGELTSHIGYQASLLLAGVYGIGFAVFGKFLSGRPGMRVPSGLLFSLSSVMAPVALYSFLRLTGVDADAHGGVILVLGSLLVSSLGLTYWSRTSFVILPALLAGAGLSNEIYNIIFGSSAISWEYSSWALVVYGVIAVVGSFLADGRTEEDYSAWGYAIGAIAIWSGLGVLNKSELGYAVFAFGGFASMFVSVLVSRRVFAFTGGAAVLFYLSHLMFTFFGGSTAFPLVLIFFGIGTIALSYFYSRNANRIEHAIIRRLPRTWQQRLPADHDEDQND